MRAKRRKMFSPKNIFRKNDFPENILRRKPFYIERNGAYILILNMKKEEAYNAILLC
jgi:hypothetical protein